jgi:hypothetical protein
MNESANQSNESMKQRLKITKEPANQPIKESMNQ